MTTGFPFSGVRFLFALINMYKGNLTIGHLIEAGLWLMLCAFLYAYSFQFDREIEIYKFGATAWPRTIILLIAIAAIGQLLYYWKPNRVTDDDDDDDNARSHVDGKWYLSTFFLLSLPLIYLLLPQWLSGVEVTDTAADKSALHTAQLICAGVLIALYIFFARKNMVGAMLTLPVLFAAMMQDLGFYALAPAFVVGVMCLMGERRAGWIALVTALIIGLLLMLFVSLLYVGLPTGNVSPFYELGTGIVNLLQ